MIAHACTVSGPSRTSIHLQFLIACSILKNWQCRRPGNEANLVLSGDMHIDMHVDYIKVILMAPGNATYHR